ncbi:carnitine O-acetyltransferase mitochondrial [Mayamaea pseudoterrestris]|nr:carnitine O-acetyltransferase mitochondrial [Mayamaea pseudoterrestris]
MLTRMTLQLSNRSLLRQSPANRFGSNVKSSSSTLATNHSKTNNKTNNTTTAAATRLPRWPTPVVTCHGDYTQETWLEELIGGPLYEHQSSLPRLPVPALDQTLRRFLPTALPLAKSEAERQSLLSAVEKFSSQAQVLQERLEQRQQQLRHTSWLQQWWNTWGYLQVRESIMINVSYFFHFKNDPSAATNLQRAAALLQAAAVFRHQVCSGQKPADIVGRPPQQTPLCSVAFKYMFHATRVPQREQDVYELHDPSRHSHVIVSRHGQFYSMPFVNVETGEPYSLKAIQKGLERIVQMASHNSHVPQLGWMTSMNRDDWADAREQLIDAGGQAMLDALNHLQSGALLLCLDDESPVSRNETAKLLLWGGNSSGKNRWFDKSVQIIVSENATAGFMGEHSMMDGMPCVGLADIMTRMTYDKCLEADYGSSDDECVVTPVFEEALRALAANGNVIGSWQDKAKEDYFELVNKHSLNVQSFQGYGSDFIKQAGFSPDAYVQMAMQVATFRLWGEQAGTYEATQVRPFLHGRTETTRSVSTQSAAFVQCMGNSPKMDEHDAAARKEKLDLLRAAVDAHVKYIGLAAKAQGVDRHFLGLSMLANKGEALPDLYADPTFVRSKRWRVSTSHLTHPNFDGWGYGEVVPDGVGLAYSIHKRHCVFNITALREHEWTDKLSNLLEEALLEMRTLVEMEHASQPVSRL